jgi:peptide/nickel transport system permease protein
VTFAEAFVVPYIVRRLLAFIPLLFLISVLSFVIIELPPGDWLTARIRALETQQTRLSDLEIQNLVTTYKLDQPVYVRYFQWIGNIVLRGNFGWSFGHDRAVSTVLGERLGTSILISSITLVFTYVVAVPIAILSAVRQYSAFDYIATFIGFIGLAVPNFLVALIILWLAYSWLGIPITGLFSVEYAGAPWSLAKFADFLKHVWVPVVVIGLAGTGGLIRVLRAMVLDELRKQYVTTARAKGVHEVRLLLRYPVRVAINPLISASGGLLPAIVSGEVLTSIVLNLPTIGPVLLGALLSQDMYLAGSIVLILSFLVLVGNLVSDLLLVAVDPRIRYTALGT